MKNYRYEILNDKINDTSEAKRGKDIFYECSICHSIIPSVPKDNINCSCGNIGIDKDMNRLFVEDYSNFIVLKRKRG
jgi:hypothetical protein